MSRPPAKTTGRFRGNDHKSLMRRLNDMGVKVEFSGGGHMKVHCPKHYVIMPATPSDGRSVRNSVSELRRAGLDL